MGIFSGLFKSRDKPQNRTAGSNYAFFLGGTTSGKAVTERSAMQMTAVYSCVRILSEAVAGLPLHLYKYTDSGGKAMALDHPLYRLLHDEPNPEMSSFVFRETLMTHLLLWGNAYAQIIRNGKGEVVALYPLMPNRMEVNRDKNGKLYYLYSTQSDDAPTMKGSTVYLDPSEVLHIPGLGFDGLVGYSPIAMAKNAIGMAIACEEYGAKFFANGAAPGGVLEHPGTIKDPTAVYSCVRILSEAVAGLPLHLYKYTDSGGKAMALDHPLYRLLHDEPNPEMSSFVFRETLMTHLLLWGNAYAQIIRNGKGEVVALYPLMPNRMEVNRDKNGKLYYLYSTQSDDAPTMKGSTVYLDPSEVLHIPGLGFDGLVGYSPIAMAKNAIGMAIACEEYGAKFFANGAAPGGVLEHPGTIKDPQRVRESWQSTFGGSGNANKIAVLEEGMKYTPIGISPEQAQFLETRKFQINEIARIFRVPPHMVGDLEKSSFSNIEQQSLEFVKYTLDPWVIRWEQSIQRSLLSKDEKAVYFVKFNLEGLLRGDYQSRMNGYAIGRQNGWMSANDIRELENLDRIPEEDGGDLYLINGNMLPLQNAGAFANINTDNGKEEKTDEEVLELEKQDGDQRGDAGTDPRENPVLKRHDR